MHQKHHHLIIATYALLALTAPLIWAQGAHAQSACPAGYTCTPVQQVANCPAGFVCTANAGSNYGGVSNSAFSNGYYWGTNAYTNGNGTYSITASAPSSATTGTMQTPLSAVCSGAAANTGTYSVNWSVTMTGGQGPYTYAWSLYNQYLGFGTDGTTSSQSFTTRYPATGSKSAYVRVTDSRGTTAMATCSSVIPETATGAAVNVPAVIHAVSPSAGTPPLIATLSGMYMNGASVVNFINSAGQFAGSATTNNVTATSLNFMVPSLPAGQYQVAVVTSACKAGCDSNRVNFTVVSSAPATTINSASLTSVCSGTPNSSDVPGITWGAQVTGGAAPYSYSWSAYSDVSRYSGGSAVSASFAVTYSTVGAKQALVRVIDSTGRTSAATCSATIPLAANSSAGITVPTIAPMPNVTPIPATSFFYGQVSCTGREPTTNIYTQKGQGTRGYGYTPTAWTYVTGTPAACQFTCINGATPAGDNCSIPAAASQAGTNGIGWMYYPSSVRAGSTFTFNVINSGTKAWGTSHDLGLSSADLNTNYQFVNLGSTAAGGYKTVTFTAPTTPGTYVLRAVEQNIAWFGQNQTITVTAQ